MTVPSAVARAWQGALAAEQQAVFGYALLGPRLSGAEQQRAYDFADAHDLLRDRTASAIAAAGRTPVAARDDYPGLYPVSSASAARRLALRLEQDCATAWRYLYLQVATARSAESLRATTQQALSASAIRATRWRAIVAPDRVTDPFPGT